MATASQAAGIDALHAMAMVDKFSRRIAARPYPAPAGRDTTLREAQCQHGCDPCFMECAVAPARLAWWEAQLARSCGSASIGRA
ncbi:hypothetical protein GR702_09100 [Novosphingobium sp. FGD1]|uniref:Uncharacterized protein n=1 Tax=Novosphingobium silvae TaxID=2692619 RepID=A0A7X4K7E0_9SPHN|nr:hypothetical protein [Novosphingobium silvae]MYL97927.1 hypothetical protein [Novosphingobium silvae]